MVECALKALRWNPSSRSNSRSNSSTEGERSVPLTDLFLFSNEEEPRIDGLGSPGTEECTCRPSDGEAETGDIWALLACQLSLTDRSQDPVSKLKANLSAYCLLFEM